MGQVKTGKLPLAVNHRHAVSLVVIYRGSPEVRLGNAFNHLDSAVTVGNQAAGQIGEQRVEVFSFYADVHFSLNYPDRFGAAVSFLDIGRRDGIYMLSKCHFMSGLRPESVCS